MKIKYLLMAVAALAAVACSDKEENPQSNPEAGMNAEKGYIALNLKSTDDITRVENGAYENGSEDEQAITGATFYFFDAAGNAFNINANGNYAYFSSTGEENKVVVDNGGTVAPNIESMTDPILVVEKYKGQFPAKVVAVVNYQGTTSISLNDLKNNLKSVGHTAGKNFIMTNSVYKNAADEVVDATELSIDNFQTSADKALDNPVTIYVERVNAKATLTASTDKINTNTPLGEDDVYVKIMGWGVIGNQTESYYIKSIDPTWTDAELGFVWNDAPFFRSYWAAKSVNDPVDPNFKFNELTNDTKGVKPIYLGEQVGQRTTYIVAAQLFDKSDKVLEIAQWYGNNYANEEALLAAVAPTLKNKLMQFNGVDTYTSIDDSQLKCVAGLAGAESYEVKFQLADDVTADNWYSFDGTTYTKVDNVDEVLAAIVPAKVWKNGMTYYYTDIRHLGDEGKDGAYGIIRNHKYEIVVNGVLGWGTPVYDPNMEVVPIRPTDKETYISAEINILSWRVVSNDVTLK